MYLAADRLGISPREITHGDAPYRLAATARPLTRFQLLAVWLVGAAAALALYIDQPLVAAALAAKTALMGWQWRLVGGKVPWSTMDLSRASAWFNWKFHEEEKAQAEAEAKARAQRG